MDSAAQIPVFNLFGETAVFPDVIHCEQIRDRARPYNWRILPHRHREMAQIFFVRQGAALIQIDGVSVQLGDGELQFIPAQSVHGLDIVQGSEGMVLSFPLALMALLRSSALTQQFALPFTARPDRRAMHLMEEIESTFAGSSAFRGQVLIGLAQAALAVIAEMAVRDTRTIEPLWQRRMLEFDRLLTEHFTEGWGAAEFASALSITPGHLSRICRAATGESASRHIEATRMTEARRLLAFTRLPVAEIGYRLGFGDPTYFSRRFRNLTGETPSNYRARFTS